MSQCGNTGNGGSPCQDGCIETAATATKNISLCNDLNDSMNIPSCYGAVVKAVGNLSICNMLPNATDVDYCLSEAGTGQ